MKYSFTALSSLIALAPLAAHAETTFYGQVNKTILGFDDGQTTEYVVGDNAYSSTRIGLKASTVLDNGLTASMLFENEMTSNPTHTLTQDNTAGLSPTPQSNTPAFAERQARVGLSSDSWGGLYLGQQSTAIDGVLLSDTAGTQDVMNADYRKIGGGLKFRNSTTGALTSLTVNSQLSDIATKRTDSLRYDSPNFGPAQFRASVAQGGDLELATTFNQKFNAFEFKGALGMEMNNDTTTGTNTTRRRYAASASLAHNNGLAATLAYTTNDIERKTTGAEEPTSFYAKVGYTFGDYAIAADYGLTSHLGSLTAPEDELTAMGLAAQYNLGKGVSLAALYRNFSLDRTATPTKDLNLWGLNMKAKF